MVKIGPSSMSGMFELPTMPWEKSKSTLSIIEEYFNGDLRNGQEICEVVISQRFYQTSPSSTQAWFSNLNIRIQGY